jgi:hypothetical protein
MNMKKFLLASLAVFVSLQILDFVIHNVILSSQYEAIMSVWRPDMMDKMWVMYVTGVVFSLLFVYIFSKGQEGKGLMEGVKYGLIIGLLVIFVGSFNQFVVYPIPYGLTWKWIIYGLIEYMILGAVTALIYKPEK